MRCGSESELVSWPKGRSSRQGVAKCEGTGRTLLPHWRDMWWRPEESYYGEETGPNFFSLFYTIQKEAFESQLPQFIVD